MHSHNTEHQCCSFEAFVSTDWQRNPNIAVFELTAIPLEACIFSHGFIDQTIRALLPASLLSVHAGSSFLHDLSPRPGVLPANPLLRPLPPAAKAADVNRLVCVGDGDVLYRCDSSSPSSSSPSDAICPPVCCSPVKPLQLGVVFPNPVPPMPPNFVQFWPRPPQLPPNEDR